MIVGCGIDIVQTGRFSKLAKNDKFIKRFFHPNEVEYVQQNPAHSIESLAARFAAKEALGKALGTGLGCLTLKNICVTKTDTGKPFLTVFDDVEKKLKDLGANCIHVSLSHEKRYAIAQVILEKTGGSNE